MPLLAIPLLTALLAQPPEPGAPPEPVERVLVDRSLVQQNVRLAAIDSAGVRIIDAAGRVQTLPRAEVLALLPQLGPLDPPHVPTPPEMPRPARPNRFPVQEPTPPAPAPAPPGRLELADGQVLPGTLTAGAEGETIAWRSTLWGPVEVALDHVAVVAVKPDRFDAAMSGPSPAQDAVLLANGDRLEGFVASIGTEVKLEQGGKVTSVPLSRVDGVRFANPVRPAGGAWVWTADTAAAVSQVTLAEGGSFTLAGRIPGASSQPTATAGAADILGVCFDTGALHPLAGMPMAAGPVREDQRRWTSPPVVVPGLTPLGAADIELPGPVRVEWTLPPGASRFSATLELPPSARLWGECEVVVESMGPSSNAVPLAREPLNQARPVAQVNGRLNGATRLRITIDPGPSGPIQDRVVVRRGLVLAPSAP